MGQEHPQTSSIQTLPSQTTEPAESCGSPEPASLALEQRHPSCASYRHAVELVGRRWSGVIIQALLGGVKRFGELRDSVPDLSDRMLSERLKELEAEGIVARIVIPEMPVRIEYHLTDKGRDLVSVVEAVTSWANRWLEPTAE
ncbi:MAG: helix-turn-helix domain-containing protein [Ktedonobacterales bacterium]